MADPHIDYPIPHHTKPSNSTQGGPNGHLPHRIHGTDQCNVLLALPLRVAITGTPPCFLWIPLCVRDEQKQAVHPADALRCLACTSWCNCHTFGRTPRPGSSSARDPLGQYSLDQHTRIYTDGNPSISPRSTPSHSQRPFSIVGPVCRRPIAGQNGPILQSCRSFGRREMTEYYTNIVAWLIGRGLNSVRSMVVNDQSRPMSIISYVRRFTIVHHAPCNIHTKIHFSLHIHIVNYTPKVLGEVTLLHIHFYSKSPTP